MPNALEQDLDHVLAHTLPIWESLRGADIFITGGTGFVGTWLVESFVWATERLRLNARATLLTRNQDAFRERSPEAAAHPSITFVTGETDSFEFPAGEFPFVIHAAPEPAGHVLEFARTHGAERLLFTSSGAVYGEQPSELTHIPEDHVGAPSTGYGEAKRAQEFLCCQHALQCGFTALIARLFTFAGPRLPLDVNFAVGNFVRDALTGGPIRVAGDGMPYRSYLYAADLTIWLWTLLIKGESARPYNVGSGEALTIRELAGIVAESGNADCKIAMARQPTPGAPPARYVPSVERARTELGLTPLISLREGIRRMVRWNLKKFP